MSRIEAIGSGDEHVRGNKFAGESLRKKPWESFAGIFSQISVNLPPTVSVFNSVHGNGAERSAAADG